MYNNGEVITSGVSYAWTSGGVASGAGSNATFAPTLNTTYQSSASFIQVVVTFADSTTFTQSIPIVVTRDGAAGQDGEDGVDGADGTNGTDGADGPGIVFRGE